MDDDSSEQKVDRSVVAEIVSSYVAKNSIAIDQIGGLIASVHRTLSGLGTNAPATTPSAEGLTPAVSIRRSVQPDYVVCLECGFRGQILRRHLLHCTWARTGGVSDPLETGERSSADRAGLFGEPLGDGKTARARPQAGGGRNARCAKATGPPTASDHELV